MEKPQPHCLQCGAEVKSKPRGRQRKYCSAKCRSAFNSARPDRPKLTLDQFQEGTLAADLLRGCAELAVFIYGADTKQNRRRVQYEAERGFYRTFHIGGMLCARKSELLEDFSSSKRGRAA